MSFRLLLSVALVGAAAPATATVTFVNARAFAFASTEVLNPLRQIIDSDPDFGDFVTGSLPYDIELPVMAELSTPLATVSASGFLTARQTGPQAFAYDFVSSGSANVSAAPLFSAVAFYGLVGQRDLRSEQGGNP